MLQCSYFKPGLQLVLDTTLKNFDTCPMAIVFAFLSGLAIGSFLNVVIDRVPRGEDIVVKPSHCDYCKQRLRWYELIPLLSYLLQGGRCRRCHKRLSWQYPLIEFITGVGFVSVYLLGFTSLLDLVMKCAIFAAGLVIFMIDRKHQIIPDSMLIGILLATVVLALPLSGADRLTHVITAVSCGGFFLALWLGTKGRGIGFGDVKLAFVLGLLLGFPGALIACYVAFLTGAIWGVILMITHKARMKSRIAFGPFLLLGIVVSHVFGAAIWAWWLGII